MKNNIFFYTVFTLQLVCHPMFNYIFAQDEFVPQWAKEVVWYQIFPDRFYNGDKLNDPDIESLKGAYPHNIETTWQVHPWNSDWYELQEYEKENGKDIWTNIQRRRFGGDLQGIIDKLDYLSELGISAVYLNPIFTAPSLHKYDGATYHHVDPHFGPDPAGDKEIIRNENPLDPSTWVWTSADKLFLKLIDEMHKRNIRIIIDGVFNHSGINCFAFQDLLVNQENSPYKDWYTVKSFENKEKGIPFEYEGWFGVKELPEWREDQNGLVEGPKNYIFNITKRWMDPDGDGNPADGIDGWRLDVAFCVGHPFWKDWRKFLKAINPDAYITAEIVDKIEANEPYLRGDEFDAVMNYNFLFICAEYFIQKKDKITVSQFDTLLKQLREAFPKGVSEVMQNLLDSHDTNRLLSFIKNGDIHNIRDWGKFFEKTQVGSGSGYDFSKPGDEERKIQKLMALMQLTYIGAPMIYYGDEAGMWGGNDPDCRKPMLWPEFQYDDETFAPDQSKITASKVEFDRDLFEYYKKLISIRNSSEALRKGSYKTLDACTEKDIFVFERESGNEKLIIILNNSNSMAEYELPAGSDMMDLVTGDNFINTNGKVNFTVSGKTGRIISSK